MTKGRSRNILSSPDDFSLPGAKILKGRKNFNRLFERDAAVCRAANVNFRYKIIDHTSFDCRVAFIVKKKLGKANKRNKIKRYLKEAYRLNQYLLSEPLQKAQLTLHGAFMAKEINLTFAETEQDVIYLLKQVQGKLSSV